MSKIALEGNALGSGTFTVAAPNTNTSYTLTLPESTGTLAASPSGAGLLLKGITYLTSGTSATYTTPTGVRALYVEVVGGGGGGGGADGQGAGTAAAGRPGGSAGYVAKLITNPSATYTYTVGAGGTAGAAGANNGTDGGNTTFTDGTLTLTAGGGNGGAGHTGTAGGSSQAGGAGGTATGGDLNIPGSRGAFRIILIGELYTVQQTVVSAVFGNSGQNIADSRTSNGNNAITYGEGGGAGLAQDVSTNYAGGDGYQGVIRITEYY